MGVGGQGGVGCASSLLRRVLHCADWLLLPASWLCRHCYRSQTLLWRTSGATLLELGSNLQILNLLYSFFTTNTAILVSWSCQQLVCGLWVFFLCCSRMRNLGFFLSVPVLLEPPASADLEFLVLFECSPVCNDWNAVTFISKFHGTSPVKTQELNHMMGNIDLIVSFRNSCLMYFF